MAFPDDVYQHDLDTTRQPLTYLLGLYNASRDDEFASYRDGLVGVAQYHMDIDTSDTSFRDYIQQIAISLGYVVDSNGYFIWKV